MRTSESINELAGALAKAQGEIEGAHKDCNNPFFKSKYADLASVWDACREPLSRHGLAIVQVPTSDGASVKVETRLVHSSGQWIEGELAATAKDDGPQSIGSGITYLRRYMLQSFVGVAPEDDDGEQARDGNGAATKQPATRPAKPRSTTQLQTGEPDSLDRAKENAKAHAERTPDQIYNDAKKFIGMAKPAQIASARGAVQGYVDEGKLDADQAKTLFAMIEKREEELAAAA